MERLDTFFDTGALLSLWSQEFAVLCLLGFYARLNRNMWEDV